MNESKEQIGQSEQSELEPVEIPSSVNVRSRGRPEITLQDILNNWPQNPDLKGADPLEVFSYDIWKLYASGASDLEIRGMIASKCPITLMSYDLWDRLLSEEPDFSKTINIGRDLAQIWWERLGRTKLTEKAFNHIMWHMNMQNRYNWSNRNKVDHDGQIDTGDSEALIAIADSLKNLINDTNPEEAESEAGRESDNAELLQG